MNKIERFEDIIAWQRARALTKEVYASTRVGQFAKDYGLKDQIQRASVSTMSNIAEGFERGGIESSYSSSPTPKVLAVR